MEWDDNVLEKHDMLVSKWDCKTTNDTCKNIKELSSTIKFVSFMDKSEETFVDSFSYHLSSWNKFGIKFMQNVLEVVSLDGFF